MNEFVQTWFPVFALVLSALAFGGAVYVRLIAGGLVSQSARSLYDRMNPLDARVTKLETVIVALPNSEDVHRLALTCQELVGEMKAMKAEMRGMAETVNATRASVREVNSFLMEEARARARK